MSNQVTMLDSSLNEEILVQVNQFKFINTPTILVNESYRDKFTTATAMINGYVFTVQFSSEVSENQCVASRMTLNLLFGMELPTELLLKPYVYQQSEVLSEVKLYMYMASTKGTKRKDIVKSHLEQQIMRLITGCFLNSSQVFPLEYNECQFELRTQIIDDGKIYGLIDFESTQIILEKEMHQKSFMLLNNNPEQMNTLNLKSLQQFNFREKLSKINVGGLSTQIQTIFRRIFASRSYGSQLVEKLGFDHVKGMLLHGPPGTGKTLMARELSKILDVEPKIINGPEITDKFVGEAQRKLRQIFQPAIKDYQQKGNESPLHVIIFDQFDAIARKRGSSQTSIGDSIVNQLLTLIDGVDSPKNILIIGMTNRKDLIDDALLRSGRLEVHVEIFLPSHEGRKQIFEIHLRKCRQTQSLNEDVLVEQLADMCKNFTGAEIAAFVKAACSYALEDHQKSKDENINFKINSSHFKKARFDITPQFGQDQKQIEKLLPQKYIEYGASSDRLLSEVDNMVKKSSSLTSGKLSILITGESGTGKSSHAALIAKKLNFSFTKFVSCDKLYSLTESQKISELIRIFQDAKRCTQSCIILDDILRLIEFLPLGSKYNSVLLQLFLNLLKSTKDADKSQIIIATAQSQQILKDLGLFSFFMKTIEIGNLSKEECRTFVCERGMKSSLDQLQDRPYSITELLSIGSTE